LTAPSEAAQSRRREDDDHHEEPGRKNRSRVNHRGLDTPTWKAAENRWSSRASTSEPASRPGDVHGHVPETDYRDLDTPI